MKAKRMVCLRETLVSMSSCATPHQKGVPIQGVVILSDDLRGGKITAAECDDIDLPRVYRRYGRKARQGQEEKKGSLSVSFSICKYILLTLQAMSKSHECLLEIALSSIVERTAPPMGVEVTLLERSFRRSII